MNPILSIHMWTSIPNEIRWEIRKIFKIPQSSNVVVNDGRIETDGTTPEDFKALTIEKMQAYLGDTSTDFHKLFDKVIAKVTEQLYPKTVVESVSTPVEAPKKRGRPAKNNG